VVQRDDDTEEAVRKRLELYAAETLPLVAFYAARGQLVEVDGLGTARSGVRAGGRRGPPLGLRFARCASPERLPCARRLTSR
jgi:hypothetical protein